MMIFAVLGTAAYQGLFQVQRVRDGVLAQSDQLAKLQRTFYWLSDDISQMVDRPIRATLGSEVPALVVSEAGEGFIEFTRAGWTNPAADVLPPRSNLQRVSYLLDGGRLIRKYAYHLDQASEESDRRRLMLDNVNDVQLRFLDSRAQWHDSWPPNNLDGGPVPVLPAAIEFTFDFEGSSPITRLFGLPN